MLDRKKAAVTTLRLAKKEPLGDADVRALLGAVDTVLVAKGRSVRTLAAKEAVLDDLRGPTGGFRAPILRVGRRLLVGFHPDALDDILKGAR